MEIDELLETIQELNAEIHTLRDIIKGFTPVPVDLRINGVVESTIILVKKKPTIPAGFSIVK